MSYHVAIFWDPTTTTGSMRIGSSDRAPFILPSCFVLCMEIITAPKRRNSRIDTEISRWTYATSRSGKRELVTFILPLQYERDLRCKVIQVVEAFKGGSGYYGKGLGH